MEPLQDGCPGRFRRRLGELEAPEQPWSERIGDEWEFYGVLCCLGFEIGSPSLKDTIKSSVLLKLFFVSEVHFLLMWFLKRDRAMWDPRIPIWTLFQATEENTVVLQIIWQVLRKALFSSGDKVCPNSAIFSNATFPFIWESTPFPSLGSLLKWDVDSYL